MKVLVDTPVWSIALRHKVSEEGYENEVGTMKSDSLVKELLHFVTSIQI